MRCYGEETGWTPALNSTLLNPTTYLSTAAQWYNQLSVVTSHQTQSRSRENLLRSAWTSARDISTTYSMAMVTAKGFTLTTMKDIPITCLSSKALKHLRASPTSRRPGTNRSYQGVPTHSTHSLLQVARLNKQPLHSTMRPKNGYLPPSAQPWIMNTHRRCSTTLTTRPTTSTTKRPRHSLPHATTTMTTLDTAPALFLT